MAVTGQDIVVEARKWLGAPYRHQGRDVRGIDCVGLPIIIARTLGLLPKDFDTSVYGRLPTSDIIDRLSSVCAQSTEVKVGSIIVIAWSKIAAHTAIYTGESMIHAYESVGKVVEHGYRGRWVRMTHSIWLIPGVEYV
jgi:cell wall-associated NlpC family hydrolase